MANAFLFCTRSCAPVRSLDTADWSSAVTSTSLRPSTPPAAFCASTAACAPSGVSAKVELALPVSEVSSPIVIVVAVTPGALAVLALLAAGATPVPAVVAVLPTAVDELLECDELPQPATTTPAIPIKATT